MSTNEIVLMRNCLNKLSKVQLLTTSPRKNGKNFYVSIGYSHGLSNEDEPSVVFIYVGENDGCELILGMPGIRQRRWMAHASMLTDCQRCEILP